VGCERGMKVGPGEDSQLQFHHGPFRSSYSRLTSVGSYCTFLV
jgi:hypothetical protein